MLSRSTNETKKLINEVILAHSIWGTAVLGDVFYLLLEKYVISLFIENLSHTNMPHFINVMILLNYIILKCNLNLNDSLGEKKCVM